MIDLGKDIHSLSDFKRNTSELVRQMKENGHPLVLTVNGRSELVVQTATSYQKLLERIEYIEALAGIGRGLEQAKRGEGRDAGEVLKDLRGG